MDLVRCLTLSSPRVHRAQEVSSAGMQIQATGTFRALTGQLSAALSAVTLPMRKLPRGWISAFVASMVLVLWPGSMRAATEESYPLLQIGTHTYTNVTVTTKSKTYVFILHSQGMTNLKVSDLPPETLKTLGYATEPTPPPQTNNAATAWAKQAIAKIDAPKLKDVETQLKEEWNRSGVAAKLPFQVPELTQQLLLEVLGLFFVIYLFHCFCWMQICKKAGHNPGILVWVPLFQLIPLLKAARMSGWWFLGFLVPGLNAIAYIIFCFKIADTRGKTAFVGLLLLLPVTNFLAFLYLAFSNGVSSEPAPQKEKRVEIMTLETA